MSVRRELKSQCVKATEVGGRWATRSRIKHVETRDVEITVNV